MMQKLQSFSIWSGLLLSFRLNDGSSIIPGGVGAHFLIVILTSIVALPHMRTIRHDSAQPVFFFSVFAVLVFFSLISAIFSSEIGLSAWRVASIFAYSASGLLLGLSFSAVNRVMTSAGKNIITIMTLVSTISILLIVFGSISFRSDGVVFEFSFGPFQLAQRAGGDSSLLRATGFFGNPNTFAFMNLFSVLFLIYFRLQLLFSLWRTIVLGIIFSNGILISGSITGLGILFGMLSIYFVLAFERFRNIVVSICLLFFVFVSLTAMLFVYFEDLPRSDLSGFSQRTLSWRALLESISGDPLFGVGFGVSDEILLDPKGLHSAHNLFLAIWSEVGIVGLFAVTFILIITILFSALHAFSGIERERRLRPFFIFCAIFFASIFVYSHVELMLLRISFQNFLFFLFCGIMFKGGQIPMNSSAHR